MQYSASGMYSYYGSACTGPKVASCRSNLRASNFLKISWGSMPPDPPSLACLCKSDSHVTPLLSYGAGIPATVLISPGRCLPCDQWCGFILSCVPAGKVESIPPTLTGLVHISLVFQQLNHTLSMRNKNYLIWYITALVTNF